MSDVDTYEAEAALAAHRQAYESSLEFRAFRIGLVAEQAMAVITRYARGDEAFVAAVLTAAIEALGAGGPDFSTFTNGLRADADWWADCASPAEVEAYAGACLKRISRAGFGVSARKRILAMMWESLGDDDRKAFLARVDPKGQFRGRAAA